MGRVFLVDLDEQQYANYYTCKACRTQIALANYFKGIKWDREFAGGIFEKAVNLTVERPDKHRQVGDHKVADVHCVKCCDYLGFKYIEVSPQQNMIQVNPQQTVVQNNMVKLIMSKLMMRIGHVYMEGRFNVLKENVAGQEAMFNNFGWKNLAEVEELSQCFYCFLSQVEYCIL